MGIQVLCPINYDGLYRLRHITKPHSLQVGGLQGCEHRAMAISTQEGHAILIIWIRLSCIILNVMDNIAVTGCTIVMPRAADISRHYAVHAPPLSMSKCVKLLTSIIRYKKLHCLPTTPYTTTQTRVPPLRECISTTIERCSQQYGTFITYHRVRFHICDEIGAVKPSLLIGSTFRQVCVLLSSLVL